MKAIRAAATSIIFLIFAFQAMALPLHAFQHQIEHIADSYKAISLRSVESECALCVVYNNQASDVQNTIVFDSHFAAESQIVGSNQDAPFLLLYAISASRAPPHKA